MVLTMSAVAGAAPADTRCQAVRLGRQAGPHRLPPLFRPRHPSPRNSINAPTLPYAALVCALLAFLFVWFRNLAKKVDEQLASDRLSAGTRFDLEQARSTAIASRQASKFFFLAFLFGYLAYIAVEGTPMYGYLMEWINLAVRWTHVIAGIMWIGASFYFIFLENNLNRTHGLRDELAGNLWAIHGGGFYYVEKYKVAPKVIPKHLHWFKYEAYFTWLSGVSLLFIVYYADAKAFMIDPTVADLSPPAALGHRARVHGARLCDLRCDVQVAVDPAAGARSRWWACSSSA